MQRDLITKNYAAFLVVQKTGTARSAHLRRRKWRRYKPLANGDSEDRAVQTAMLTMIFLFTGMRISELFTLSVSSIHLEAPVPYLQGGVKKQRPAKSCYPNSPAYPAFLPVLL